MFGRGTGLVEEHRRLKPRRTAAHWKILGRPTLAAAVCIAIGLATGGAAGHLVARHTTVIGFDGRLTAPVRPAEEARWVSAPSPVDVAAQPMPRVDPRDPAPGRPAGEVVVFSERPDFVDTITFAVPGGVRMRLAGVEGLTFNAVCTAPDGARLACGNRARGAIREWFAGQAIVCERRGTAADGAVLATCAFEGRDVAAEMVARGFARRVPPTGG